MGGTFNTYRNIANIVNNSHQVSDAGHDANSPHDWNYNDDHRTRRNRAQVNRTEQDAPCDPSRADLEIWHTATKVECYLSGRAI